MVVYRLLNASLDKLPITLKRFPSVDENGIENDFFKRKLAYPHQKGNTLESFYKQLKLGREDYFSTLKQSYPDFEERLRTQAKLFLKK